MSELADKKEVREAIGRAILDVLNEAGVSQRELARRLGLEPGYVSNWVRGGGVSEHFVYSIDTALDLPRGSIYRLAGTYLDGDGGGGEITTITPNDDAPSGGLVVAMPGGARSGPGSAVTSTVDGKPIRATVVNLPRPRRKTAATLATVTTLPTSPVWGNRAA